jgi:hypothetical protein
MTHAADCVNHLGGLADISVSRKAEVDWPVLEERIGLRLPEDYKLLVEMLPDGWFRGFVRVLRPRKSADGGMELLHSEAAHRLEDMRQWRAGGYGTFPYPIYPEPAGLLPWGSAIRGALFFWLTGPGDPGDWPVITASAEWDYWDRFDGTVCEFLVAVATGRCDARGFADGPITQVTDAGGAYQIEGQAVDLITREPVFKPIAERQPAQQSSGARPDFWVRRLLDLGRF